mgnify:FL=1|jgi:hypothetical protein|tara:strand:- start:1838 stop:2095 length:258 start_codon:yes stop_codon:yes gene_type:complete
MKNKNKDWPLSRKLKKADGTIAHIWGNKLHNWEGPALIPEGNTRKAEYYLYGLQYDKEEYNELVRGRTGLPWYKQPAPKGAQHRN